MTTRQPTTLPSHLFCVPSCFNVVLLFCSNRFAQKPARDAVRLAWMERDDEIAAVKSQALKDRWGRVCLRCMSRLCVLLLFVTLWCTVVVCNAFVAAACATS